VVGKRGRNTDRAIHIGRRIGCRCCLGALDLALDLANSVEVLIDTNAVGRSDFPFEPLDVAAERIEEAVPITQCRATAVGAFSLAEETFEHDAGMRLGRKRGRR
jgi:hypothetical protein